MQEVPPLVAQGVAWGCSMYAAASAMGGSTERGEPQNSGARAVRNGCCSSWLAVARRDTSGCGIQQ